MAVRRSSYCDDQGSFSWKRSIDNLILSHRSHLLVLFYRVQSFASPMQSSLMGSMGNLTGNFSQFGINDVSATSYDIKRMIRDRNCANLVDTHPKLASCSNDRCPWGDLCQEPTMVKEQSTTTTIKDPVQCFTSL